MSDSPVQFRDAQTLRYRSAAQKNVPRDTVRVNITINALVSNADRDHGALQRRMRETLGRFIPVEWVLTAPRRQADTSGFERVTVEANARAPLAENYNLATCENPIAATSRSRSHLVLPRQREVCARPQAPVRCSRQ
jgi:hypothetical protein